jgi:hypothetical protein
VYQFSIKTFSLEPVIIIIIIIESIILRFVQDTYAKLNSFQLSHHHHPPDLVVGSVMSLIQFISFGFNKSLVVKLYEYLLATCGCEWVGISVGQFSLLLLLLLLLLFQRKNPKQREPLGEVWVYVDP